MAFPIRNLVPYQVTFTGNDFASGKKITNTHYIRNAVQTVAAPVYGGNIAGPSSTNTLLANLAAIWQTAIMPRMNANYLFTQAQMQAILGKRYSSPLFPILSLIPGAPVIIFSAGPHGLSTGDPVVLQGVTFAPGLNTTFTITVLTPFSFSLDGSNFFGIWSGDGTFQQVQGTTEFLLGDNEVIAFASIPGGVVGDALNLFSTSSIRRLNGGVGRHFRSRFSLSPMSEVDVVDGGFTIAQRALMVTALGLFGAGELNGGTDVTSKFSFWCAVSKLVAFGLFSPFTQSNTWCSQITSFVQQRNNGSLVRRKPRLTSVIA